MYVINNITHQVVENAAFSSFLLLHRTQTLWRYVLLLIMAAVLSETGRTKINSIQNLRSNMEGSDIHNSLHYEVNGELILHTSSQARVSAHGFRDPGKLGWAQNAVSCSGGTTLSAYHSSCLTFTNAIGRVLIFMRFWKADPPYWNLKGGWEAVRQMLPLSWTVNGWELDLPKQGELSNNYWH